MPAMAFHQSYVTHIVVNTDKFFCHCVFIYYSFYGQLVTILHDCSSCCFCLLAESIWYNTRNNQYV